MSQVDADGRINSDTGTKMSFMLMTDWKLGVAGEF